jgi:alpha-tubulin suppressor-like RCC1 family protein
MRWILLTALLCACETKDLVWYYDIDGAPAWIEVEIREGGCDGNIVYADGFAPGGAMTPPSLGSGQHSFVVRAHDASCNVFAEGCETVTLPLGTDSLTVTAGPTTARPACSTDQTCEAGQCVGGDMPDAGMSDAGMTTECETGCFDGTQCVSGNSATACGSDGGACEVCGCGGDTCVDGHCVPTEPVTGVTAGAGHTCAIAGGVLYCWGDNAVGMIGGSCCTDREDPAPSDARSDWTQVVVSPVSSCALRGTEAACWGANNYNQLGRGAGSPENSPMILAPMGTTAWTAIEMGVWHTLGIDDGGALYCWGSSSHSACASAVTEIDVPTQLGSDTGWTSACGGFYHTCGVRNGVLYCWGWNRDGETGIGSEGGVTSGPTRVDDANDWEEVTCGYSHTCARRADGRVFCFGCGDDSCYEFVEAECGGDCTGTLGNGVAASSPIPIEVAGDLRARAIDAGIHTCAVDMEGTLWCWGTNVDGQLGVGDDTTRDEPARVSGGWTDVSAGYHHTCAIREGGALYCWGRNEERQLGTGGPIMADTTRPARVCVD